MKMKRYDGFKYEKQVHASDTRIVTAEVIKTDLETGEELKMVGLKFFIFGTLKFKMDRANKWADRRIKILEEYEAGPEFFATFRK